MRRFAHQNILRRMTAHRQMSAVTAAERKATEAKGGSGYFMPAEWETQQRIWLGWPQRPYVWRENAGPAQRAWVQVNPVSILPRHTALDLAVDPAPSVAVLTWRDACAQVATAISRFEHVTVCANDEQVCFAAPFSERS